MIFSLESGQKMMQVMSQKNITEIEVIEINFGRMYNIVKINNEEFLFHINFIFIL